MSTLWTSQRPQGRDQGEPVGDLVSALTRHPTPARKPGAHLILSCPRRPEEHPRGQMQNMRREMGEEIWPTEEDDLLLDYFRFPKATSVLQTLVCGLFSLVLIAGLIAIAIAGGKQQWPTELVAGVLVFALFGLISIVGVVSGLKGILNPPVSVATSRKGVFLNLRMDPEKALFIDWGNIKNIEEVELEYSQEATSGMFHFKGKTICLFLVNRENVRNSSQWVMKRGTHHRDGNIYIDESFVDAELHDLRARLSSSRESGVDRRREA